MVAFCDCWGKEFEPILFECLNALCKEEEVEETPPAFDACTTARAAWTLSLRNMFLICFSVTSAAIDSRRVRKVHASARRKNPIRSVWG